MGHGRQGSWRIARVRGAPSFWFGATSASLSFTGPFDVNRQFGRTASIDALGDSAFAAFLGWEEGEHHWNLTLTGVAPTGFYSSTALAFTGLHRPGVDLKGGYTFLSLQTGIEASAALGFTVNAINTATNYQSGAELHFEGALNQHFPFGLAVGAGGYYYQQVTADWRLGGQCWPLRGARGGRWATGQLYVEGRRSRSYPQRPVVS
jgi:hypothetical protein